MNIVFYIRSLKLFEVNYVKNEMLCIKLYQFIRQDTLEETGSIP